MKALFFIVSLLLCGTAMAKIIHTGSSRNYKTITAALAAAIAGDTILVDAGNYKEKNLVIKKSIVLKGMNYPVLDGEKKYEIISITADNVTIDGFVLQHSGVSSMTDYAAIKIYNRQSEGFID